jgi:hypothetical protein
MNKEPIEWISEFDKEFCSTDDFNRMSINFFRVSNYSRDEPIRSTGEILRNDLVSFISSQIKQAEERVRDRIVKEIEKMNEYHTDIGGRNVVFTDDYVRKEDIIKVINQNNE